MNQHTTEQQRRGRFFSRVKKSGGCWMWAGALDDGYGMTSYRGKNIRTHRLSWTFAYGPIPKGKWVLHKCDVRACVNPEHLYLGDIYQNNADTKERDGYARGTEHPQAKLTEEQARAIFIRAHSGESFTKIAEDFPVCRKIVSLIKRGLRWSHATKL